MKKIIKPFAVFALIFFIGFIFLISLGLFAPKEGSEFMFFSEYTLNAFILTMMILLLGYALVSYLEIGFGLFGNINQKEIHSNYSFKSKMESIQKTLENIKKDSLPKEAINKFARNVLNNEAVSIVEERIKREFRSEIIKERNYELIQEELNELEKNVALYINKLSRGSSINLVIGVLTTFIAIVGLSVFMFENQIDFENTNKLLSHYIPRLSIVIFIEIFSFFFLKLYRNNLEDVKYFENERTNINSKKAALKFAYLTENTEVINEILLDLSKTERNFKLEKDETTVTLEKVRLENTQSSTNLQTLMSLLKLKDKE